MGACLSVVLFFAKHTRLHVADKPAKVVLRPKFGSTSTTIALDQLVKRLCPAVLRPFVTPWWLFNGHLQTAYCAMGDFTKVNVVEFERTLLCTADGGTVGLDFTPSSETAPDAPILVVLTGLTGGSYESYIRAVLEPAYRSIQQGGLGYRAVIINFRGCSGVPVTSPYLYSAGCTSDMRAALLHISKLYPAAPLLGLGFSLGASVLIRYLGEEGNRSRIKSACVMGCPWDLYENCEYFTRNWLPCQIYARTMGQNLQRIIQLHAEQLSTLPAAAAAVSSILSTHRPTLKEVDAVVTTLTGSARAPFPFPDRDIDSYYRWASAQPHMDAIRVPVLALHAADDPVITITPVNSGIAVSPWVVFAVTPGGGHLGWFARRGDGSLGRWFVEPVLEWLRATAEEMDVPGLAAPREIVESGGVLREDGIDHVECRVISSGGSTLVAAGSAAVIQGL
ncbi:hypothetical protein PHLGIDRAFT_105769 [Phlebiopsis gigantea 11061_1 CR5-6]|uniref:AB hydrolase-1 domain-containing protein n=1 Tax=Phlebiopsis gigantea (strain 11061_1 CR5-6) TaxID=745531 RepID=A0A0C3SAX0_PHLG1|nr:hypothetical protein PHLGIDRAFT_105769 [Phlebiopsis gigantea 11061_1 CR5-6]